MGWATLADDGRTKRNDGAGTCELQKYPLSSSVVVVVRTEVVGGKHLRPEPFFTDTIVRRRRKRTRTISVCKNNHSIYF